MTDQPSSDDSPSTEPTSRGTDPGVEWQSPLAAGLRLWRESVLAAVGVLAFLAGANGWLYVLDADYLWSGGYTLFTLLGDLAYLFVGVFLLFAAAGAAARRVRDA
ncbi:hypothetical protein [Halobacterium yunchengense]|uniref:hypothetical protein n=1 Tax=Halobacterium yunchengense TaxID=3108497 RepID=UPI00300B81CF